MGTAWMGCLPKLTAGLGESANVTQLYLLAWDNFRENPHVFFSRLGFNARQFLTEFPDVMWKGYSTANTLQEWLWRIPFVAVFLAGMVWFSVKRMSSAEARFWPLLGVSIVTSAAFIYPDDGPRTLAASHPLIALFFAVGFGCPVQRHETGGKLWKWGAIGAVICATLLVAIPSISHRVYYQQATPPRPDGIVVFGGARMSGFLVVADTDAIRRDVPSLHLSQFKMIVQLSDIEIYQGLLHPLTPQLPFGFVYAPRAEKGTMSFNQYIVPASVVERSDVPLWLFEIRPWQTKPDGYGYWMDVTKATALP
jgi:hypothetical protein